MNPHLLTLLLLVAAGGAYAVQAALGGVALLVAAGLLEGAFWVRALRRP